MWINRAHHLYPDALTEHVMSLLLSSHMAFQPEITPTGQHQLGD